VLLRRRHEHLQGLGVEVLAISVDHLPALRVFDKALAEFPFPLAADWHRGICRQYGVLDEEKQTARRVLMLFDRHAVLKESVIDFDPAEPERMDRLVRGAPALVGQA
jgi:peroxiredoxin